MVDKINITSNSHKKHEKIIFVIPIILVAMMSSLIIITWQMPSIWNDVLGLEVPEGMNFNEAINYAEKKNECLKWGSWGGQSNDEKSWECTLNENIVKPFGFTEKCGDLYQKYVYTCKSSADGCPTNYVLTRDHWNSYICVKQDYYDNPCRNQDFPIVDGWTKSGVQCRSLTDSEKLDLLLEAQK